MTSLRTLPRLAALLVVGACVRRPPSIEGGPGAPRQPNDYWTVPRGLAAGATTSTPLSPVLVPTSLGRMTLAEIVDLALRNNPTTRLSWAQARAAANSYGASRGPLLPAVTVDGAVTRSRSLAAPGRPAGERTQYGPSLGLSYLVLDFGGRSGSIDVARQTAIAADLSHNAAVQNTILQVESALFTYLATRALRDAERVAVEEATASLNAAEERRRVGLATIADVLQARTARSQAQLALESLEGGVLVAQGGLAVAMGLPANASFEVPNLPDAPSEDSLRVVTQSVDTLIAVAARARPDLAAVRAQAAAAAAEVRVARSGLMPAISFNANGGYTGSNNSAFQGRTYTLALGFDLPVFTGFSRQYDVQSANDQLEAARARTEVTRQQIALQVFTAYYTLQTATDRVRTAADLLASATESESVARGRYREGVGSIVDLLIAQSALADARAQQVQLRWQWRGALAQLAHDVGVLGIHGEALAPLGADTSRTGR
jgi:outer membrane protein TolC